MLNLYKVKVSGHYRFENSISNKGFIREINVVANNVENAIEKTLINLYKFIEGVNLQSDIQLIDYQFNNVSLYDNVIIDVN